jgi:hypothetical protein
VKTSSRKGFETDRELLPRDPRDGRLDDYMDGCAMPGDDIGRSVYRSSETLSPRRLLELTRAMDDIELEQALSNVPLFSTLKSLEITNLARNLLHLVVQDGEFVYRQVRLNTGQFLASAFHFDHMPHACVPENKAFL